MRGGAGAMENGIFRTLVLAHRAALERRSVLSAGGYLACVEGSHPSDSTFTLSPNPATVAVGATTSVTVRLTEDMLLPDHAIYVDNAGGRTPCSGIANLTAERDSVKVTGVAAGPCSAHVSTGAFGGTPRRERRRGRRGHGPMRETRVPTNGGAGELWVASNLSSESLAVYPLDSAGAASGGATLVPTGLSTGIYGITALTWDAASNSFFVATDTLRRVQLTRATSSWSLRWRAVRGEEPSMVCGLEHVDRLGRVSPVDSASELQRQVSSG
jgi:hypothetical protein